MCVRLILLAVLCVGGLCKAGVKTLQNEDQLLKFTIPLGWGATQLLETEDPDTR